MNLGKKLLIVCISFLFGIVAAIYLINPFIQKRETVNQEQQIEALKEEIKTKESTNQIKKEAEKNSYEGLPNDTRTERELEAIQSVASDFLTLYYQTTTENVDKNLEKIKKLTIDNNGEKYRPGWLTQHASNVLVQEVVSEQYYTDLHAVNGKASVMAFLSLQAQIGEGDVFPEQFLNRVELKKDENNVWKVTGLKSTATSDDYINVEDFYS
ncbi:hypothetical protein [Enterococcus faecium]|uniref:hypothetical protein n=1 Tax=Enterococcus faecium TaxID=1352 RepID=UPI000CF1E080|nr:hypothetical protein [Enterococcus faecium]EGP4986325.1 hypothetical protein [Enterococcus faecium]EME7172696.1 hypothetical protein [Enterococcus faecium]PQE58044.1 hypothetical protein CUS10_14245 [Enterococcus faecium]